MDLQAARQRLASCPNVWDMTLPWPRIYWQIETLRRYRSAGYTFVNLTIQDMPATYEGVIGEIQEFRRRAAPHADWMCFADNLAAVDEARAAGRLALGINVQDSALVHDDFERLHVLKGLGVRHMLLAYQTRNRAADGCAEAADAGLSALGRRLVREMNRVGMIVDLSHTGRRSTLDAMQLAEAPVIFSHSGAQSICRHIRNIDDEQIRACAATDGVVGIVGIGAFVGDPDAKAESVFRHLDHVVQLVGARHAGIGTDFIDEMQVIWPSIVAAKDDAWPDPYGTQLYHGRAFAPEQLVELVALMIQRGYPDDAIEGILGANFRRVYEKVHRNGAASELATCVGG